MSNLLQLALIPPETKDTRSPSPPYRNRAANFNDSPQPASKNNPNVSGFSLSGDEDLGKGANKTSLFKESTRSPPKSANLNASFGGNNSALYGKAAGVLKYTKSATEFDVSDFYFNIVYICDCCIA